MTVTTAREMSTQAGEQDALAAMEQAPAFLAAVGPESS